MNTDLAHTGVISMTDDSEVETEAFTHPEMDKQKSRALYWAEQAKTCDNMEPIPPDMMVKVKAAIKK